MSQPSEGVARKKREYWTLEATKKHKKKKKKAKKALNNKEKLATVANSKSAKYSGSGTQDSNGNGKNNAICNEWRSNSNDPYDHKTKSIDTSNKEIITTKNQKEKEEEKQEKSVLEISKAEVDEP
jgi:hypothetical protein